jgi:hypothetical protein
LVTKSPKWVTKVLAAGKKSFKGLPLSFKTEEDKKTITCRQEAFKFAYGMDPVRLALFLMACTGQGKVR